MQAPDAAVAAAFLAEPAAVLSGAHAHRGVRLPHPGGGGGRRGGERALPGAAAAPARARIALPPPAQDPGALRPRRRPLLFSLLRVCDMLRKLM